MIQHPKLNITKLKEKAQQQWHATVILHDLYCLHIAVYRQYWISAWTIWKFLPAITQKNCHIAIWQLLW